MYKWSKQVVFHPWVGDNYGNASKKVLLLGDSHYDEIEPYDDYTSDIIRKWCFELKKPGRFLTGIIWTLFGNCDNLEDKYSYVAFCNYVQKMMPGPRVSPKDEDYISAQKPFVEVLEKLSPDLVVSFGDNMTWHFPCIADGDDSWKKDSADEAHDVWISEFTVGDLSIPVYALPHPSGSKFNRQTYFEYFKKHGLTL